MHVVAGQAEMYNLTVMQDHTYAVGDAQAVVHNECIGDNLQPRQAGAPTRGILDTGAGEPTGLISGREGMDVVNDLPSDAPDIFRQGVIRNHVAAKAAAIMRTQRLEEATLWINNTPCGGYYGCGNMLPQMLPEGAILHVNIMDASSPTGWLTSDYIGLPDSAWSPVPWPPGGNVP